MCSFVPSLIWILACSIGKYGINCSQTCGHCFNNPACHHENGTCTQGCAAGYQTHKCNTSKWYAYTGCFIIQTLRRATTHYKQTVPFRARNGPFCERKHLLNKPYRSVQETDCSVKENTFQTNRTVQRKKRTVLWKKRTVPLKKSNRTVHEKKHILPNWPLSIDEDGRRLLLTRVVHHYVWFLMLY